MAIKHLGANSRGADMAELQDDKYQTHNDHIDLLADRFLQGTQLAIGFASGSTYTLSVEEWTQNFYYHLVSDASPSVDAEFELLLPATQGQCVIFNDTGFDCYVGVNASPGTRVFVGYGSISHLYNDGESVIEAKRDVYDISFLANTINDGALLGGHIAPRAFRIPAGGSGSAGYIYTTLEAGEVEILVSLQKNDVEFGTVLFEPLVNAGTVDIPSAANFAIGDRLTARWAFGSPTTAMSGADALVTVRGIAL